MAGDAPLDKTLPLSGAHGGIVRPVPRRVMLVVAHTVDAARIGERLNPGQTPVPLNRLEAPLASGRLTDPQMSRSHAEFRRDPDGAVAVRDVGSSHGTFVNGKAIKRHTWCGLTRNDVVRVGGTLLAGVNAPVQRPRDASIPQLVGVSDAMCSLRQTIHTHAPGNLAILVLGEVGVGKELVAEAVRDLGRPRRPFAAQNMAALSPALFESEMFGHAPDAFNNARARAGLFATADGGTLFLDEIGELHLDHQAKLLRALQTGMIRPVGSDRPRHVDVRVVAATNVDLHEAIAQGRFRQDLHSRLTRVTIRVPPLRDRIEDIPTLAHHFAAMMELRDPVQFSVAALARLMRYPWPDNVRGLKNVVGQMVRAAGPDERVAIPAMVDAELVRAEEGLLSSELPATLDREGVEAALRRAGGNMTEAARLMGKDRSHFYRVVKKLGLDQADFRRSGGS